MADTVPPNPPCVLSLDDAVTCLMQLEPSDRPGFERLGEMLEILSNSAAFPARVCELAGQGASIARAFLAGEIADAEDVLIEVSSLLEEAGNILESVSGSGPTAYPAADSAPPSGSEAQADPGSCESLPPDADPELLGDYVAEALEFLEGAEAALLALESDPEDAEAVNTVFRAFHTIKGTSGFLGLEAHSTLAHSAETLLSRVRDREIRCTGGYADLALRSVDMLRDLVRNVQDALNGRPLIRPEGYDGLRRLLAAPEAAGISQRSDPPPRPQSQPADLPLFDDWGEAANSAAWVHEREPQAPSEAARLDPLLPPSAASPIAALTQRNSPGERQADAAIRVSAGRLDRLIDTVGELVIAQSMVVQDRTVLHGGHYELAQKVTHLGKIVRELQDLSMSMRMMPLKPTFQKMSRLVRDLALKGGKRIALLAEDNDTEIDRNMVEIIHDLLVHMLRNAVDHGIETPDVRERAGKDPAGTIFLSASQSGGSVVVDIRDDGRGLNRGRIVEKAISQGLLESDQGLSDSEVYNLIFSPGFSTADTITDVSGRGVGMDVVRRGVDSLRGRIDIVSEPGSGCTFSVRLPLTLAITDGMLVQVGTERYIIPTSHIHLCFRPAAEMMSKVAGRGEMVLLRDELMPIFRLHGIFGIKGAVEDPTAGLLVVVGDGERRCTLLVDELLGQQQVVAKPLGDCLKKVEGISGAAILGDGRVGLLLETSEIIALARQDGGSSRPGWEAGSSAA